MKKYMEKFKENYYYLYMTKKIKILLTLCVAFIALTFGLKSAFALDDVQQALRAGTFLRVLNLTEISTLMADIDDELTFLNTQDMYLYETNAIPANTKIFGEVEDVLEPVQGRDGAIKIKITKMITPDKKVYKVKGHIYSQNDNYLGGAQTATIYYRKVPHYHQGLRGFLQAAPTNILENGKHTVILPGAELFVVLEEDVILK